MHDIISQTRSTEMSINVQFKIFEALVVLIMTYGCELWGLKKFEMTYGGTGRYPLRITVSK